MRSFKYILFIIGALVIFQGTVAYPGVDVNDDVYDMLLRLEAEGIIQSGLLTTRPLNHREILRLITEAEMNSEYKGPVIRQIIDFLNERFQDEFDGDIYIKPFDNIYGKYIHSDSDRLSYNDNGDSYEDGSNFRLGIVSKADFQWLYLYINPEIRYDEKDVNLLTNRAYAMAIFRGVEVELGKDSQWWGPGYHGAILVSNNAEPLTILKLTNARPIILPSVFRYLGIFKVVFFVTQLEKDREVSSPYLWGLRVNLKPNPYIELGFNRTALLGGEGRPEGFKTWMKSFSGRGENESGVEAGDQRAGLDLKLTLPLRWQPVQLYAEGAGEDEAAGFPSKWAYLAGIYLPRVLNIERLDFRIEYATTHVKDNPNVWYIHHIYRSGYTYKGRIIGHHVGTDSRDVFLEAKYYMPEMNNGRITLSYDMEKHNLSGKIRETMREVAIKINLPFKKAMSIKTAYSYGKFKNLDNIRGRDKNVNIFIAGIMYRF